MGVKPNGNGSVVGRVLVIDDDPMARDWLQRVLTRGGYRVSPEATALAGLRRAQERPDLVISDVALPDASGLEVAALLRADPLTTDLPILHISAVRTSPPERAAGLRAGADTYLTWPLDAEELLAVVGALLRMRAAEAGAREALHRVTRLHEVTGRLARGGAVDDLATALAETLMQAFGASMVAMGTIDDAGSALTVHTGSVPEDLRRWSLEDDHPFSRVVREQERLVLEEFPTPGGRARVEATVLMPLCTDEGLALGALAVGFPWPGPVPAAMLEDLQAVADGAGQAVHRAQLAAAERRARERLAGLQQLTAALARAEDERAVAEASLTYGLPLLEAGTGAVFAVDDDEKAHLLATRGTGVAPDDPVHALGDLLSGPGADRPGVRAWTAGQLAGTSPPRAAAGAAAEHPLWLAAALWAGHVRIGELCVRRGGDTPPGPLDLQRLGLVGETVADALRRAQLAAQQRRAFLRLQQRLLPAALPEHPEWTLAARYRAAEDGSAVGGDWFDAILGPAGQLTLVIGDVAGHGTDAAATMSRLRHSLHALLTVGVPVASAVALLNDSLVGDDDGSFATLLAVSIPPRSDRLTVVDAGHPLPLCLLDDGTVGVVDAPANRPLGVSRGWEYRASTWDRRSCGSLLLYTDGLIEQGGLDLDDAQQALAEAMRESADREPDDQAAGLIDSCATPRDDSAVLLARRRPVTPSGGRGSG